MKRPAKANNIMTITTKAAESGRLVYSGHANQRMKEREIVKPEVEYVLTKGHHEAKRDSFNKAFESWDYAVRGKTVDGRNLRIVVAVIDPELLIITTIDLDKEE